MTDNFVSKFGVSSRKPITTCTIFVVACLSWPCFLESNRTCSFKRLQSPDSFAIVTIAMMMREVDARSEACNMSGLRFGRVGKPKGSLPVGSASQAREASRLRPGHCSKFSIS